MTENRITSRRVFIAMGGAAMASLVAGFYGLHSYINRFAEGAVNYPDPDDMHCGNALFMKYPELKEVVPWIPLGDFPTPVEKPGSFPGLENHNLYVKRDDLSSSLYGGNKVRKLEYLFGEALLEKRDAIITIGSIGSNHTLTTAILGASLGLPVELCLFNQPVSDHVRENLKGMLSAGARLHYTEDMTDAYRMARKRFKGLRGAGKNPYFIISGGTCGLGNFGYCSAAFELKRQVEDGEMPMPSAIFVPVGTCGTISGLLAGLKLAELPVKVIGVKVYDSFPANSRMIKYYAQNVLNHVRHHLSLPALSITNNDFELLDTYLGDGYGIPTAESIEAVKRAQPGLKLETTYTGKTLAACLDYCKGEGRDKPVLFWNTCNSRAFETGKFFNGLPRELESLFI